MTTSTMLPDAFNYSELILSNKVIVFCNEIIHAPSGIHTLITYKVFIIRAFLFSVSFRTNYATIPGRLTIKPPGNNASVNAAHFQPH